MCLNHCYADGASTRIGSRRLRNFGAYKDFVKEWRSGFNRYRRTWAGPKLTTEIGAFLAPGRGSKERHSFPYFFLSLSRMSQIVGAGGAYASHYQYITRSHGEGEGGDKGSIPALYITCTQHNFFYCRRGVQTVHGIIDGVAGTQKKVSTEGTHVIEKIWATAHSNGRGREGNREKRSLTLHSMAMDWELGRWPT